MNKEYLYDTTPLYQRKRYLIFILAFLGYLNLYTMRVDFSVAIFALSENRTIKYENGSESYVQTFKWTKKERGMALSTFFYGYIATQFIGGYVASKFSGRLVFGAGILGAGLMTFFTPLLCYRGISYLYVSRIFIGFCCGLSYPSVNAVYDNWCPPNERSRVTSFGISGVYFGTVIGMALSGYIAANYKWEWIFYGFGIAASIWVVIWFIITKDSPAFDKWILKSEKKFILDSLNRQESVNDTKIPWAAIFTSMPVYAIAVAYFSYCWGFTLLNQFPSYMREIFGYDLKDNVLLILIPYFTITLLLFPSGYLADWIIRKNFLSITQVRKFFNNISLFGQMAFLLMAGYFTNKIQIVTCISLSVGIGAFAMSGFLANTLDIAPQYSSIILGLANSFATLPGIISPILTDYIVQTPSASEYKTVFFIASGIYLIGIFFYAVFASGKVQPWISSNVNASNDNENIENSISDEIQLSEVRHGK